jgi:hypothetical protein
VPAQVAQKPAEMATDFGEWVCLVENDIHLQLASAASDLRSAALANVRKGSKADTPPTNTG